MTIFYILLAIAAGFAMAFQSPTNATLSRHIGNMQATCISFGGGVICLAVLTLLMGSGDITNITDASWWQLLGGLYGVTIVLGITYAIPHLGAALTSTILMLGQITTGAILDTFGLLQLQAMPLAPGRVAGCGIVLIGIVLVYIGKRKQEKGKAIETGTPVVIGFLLLAGIAGSIQSPTNMALAAHIGSIEASFISFLVGFLLILVITFIVTKGHMLKQKREGIRWWMTTGGIYGAAAVFINIVAIPHLGSTFLLIATMLGQLTGGMLVDSFGLLRTAKIKANGWRWAGMVIIALGVVIVALTK